ncbi:DoxX family protein [Flexibacterium corallicola]|uniref:DoxX family protein n=1 Tax=Flexibacterium corallicola TaxID=3037259 RepID=UPI00286EF1C0|nr:DoxX family protein [Pseudovibrio sp. M1P-2-3]
MEKSLSAFEPVAAPVGRAFVALLFIGAGWGKITGYSGVAGYMEMMGVPSLLLPLVILLELGGGLMLLVGYQTRLIALLLAGFSLLSGALFHLVPSFGMEGMAAQNEMTHFMKNLALTGGLGFILAYGAGAFSLDKRKSS